MKKANLIYILLFSILLIHSLTNTQEIKELSSNVLTIFFKTILPSLLPFLILNQLIIKCGIIDLIGYLFQHISSPLFKISGKGASIILIGVLNGFPSSAIFTSLLLKNKQIEKEEAQRIINCIFFPSISYLFIILKPNLTNNLFICLTTCIYLTGFLFLYLSSLKYKNKIKLVSFKETINNIKEKSEKFLLAKELKEVITYSFNTLINILGTIVLFSIPTQIIEILITSNYSNLFKGLIEFSIPSIELSLLNINKKSITLMLGVILSFSSFSSIMQANLFINEASLSTKCFFYHRILISVATFIILYLFLFFL